MSAGSEGGAPDAPHDILAAEEFGVPAPDPDLHADEPHDVLAAETFEVGAADPALHPGPLRVPDDPSPGAEVHDVLAAEEFPVPAGRRGHLSPEPDPAATRRPRRAVMVAVVGVAAAIGLRRRSHRG